MNKKNINELKKFGYTLLTDIVNDFWISKLSNALDKAFLKHKKLQEKNSNEIKSHGVALHVLVSDDTFIDFLKHLQNEKLFNFFEENFFKSKCILNSFSGLNNLPNNKNFSSVIHRDLRFYSGKFPMMLNCLFMIDDFTKENGATYLLPFSHLKEQKPSDEEFFNEAIQVTGKKGDMIVFNSNLWHCSAPNSTSKDRKAIPMTLSKSFMKQLLDYPRALGYDKIDSYDTDLQQLLGYHSRVPASLEEWYQPEHKRFYKKGQD